MLPKSVVLLLHEIEIMTEEERRELAVALQVLYPDAVKEVAERAAKEERAVQTAWACDELMYTWRDADDRIRHRIQSRGLFPPLDLTGEVLARLGVLDVAMIALFDEIRATACELRAEFAGWEEPKPRELELIRHYIEEARKMPHDASRARRGPSASRSN